MSAPPPVAADLDPIDDATFGRLMAALGPFEPAPRLAVAVSGGADSLCLALLAKRWSRHRHGRVLAFHIDHRLRSESTAEAAIVAGRLQDMGIPCHCLTWKEARGGSAVQERARQARHALLEEACHERGILHLLLAHHADDQAETVAMRAARGVQPVGLAGMSAIRETRALRLLRPLLPFSRRRIEATLRHHGVSWLEDPSNRSSSFERVRLRQSPSLDRLHWQTTAQAATARRQVLEAAASDLLARSVSLRPEGWVSADWPLLAGSSETVTRLALSALLRTLGGALYPPPAAAVDRLVRHMRQAQDGQTSLHGVLVRRRGDGLRLWREFGRIRGTPQEWRDRTDLHWDGRYLLRRNGPAGRLAVVPLGSVGRDEIDASLRQALHRRGLNMTLAATLPAILEDKMLVGVPSVTWMLDAARPLTLACTWRPLVPLTGAPHHSSLL